MIQRALQKKSMAAISYTIFSENNSDIYDQINEQDWKNAEIALGILETFKQGILNF